MIWMATPVSSWAKPQKGDLEAFGPIFPASFLLYTKHCVVPMNIRKEADFPNIDSNSAAVSFSPHYRMTLAPDVPCGSAVRLDLSASYSAGQDDSSFVVLVGSPQLDQTATDVPLALPAFSGIPAISTIQIDDAFTITDVEVAVNVLHQDISELVIEVTSPAATKVTLHNHTGSGQPPMPNSGISEKLRRPEPYSHPINRHSSYQLRNRPPSGLHVTNG